METKHEHGDPRGERPTGISNKRDVPPGPRRPRERKGKPSPPNPRRSWLKTGQCETTNARSQPGSQHAGMESGVDHRADCGVTRPKPHADCRSRAPVNAKPSPRTRRGAKASHKAITQVPSDPLQSFSKGYRQGHYDDDGNTPCQHDWWDDTDMTNLNDIEALSYFLSNCDRLLEPSDSRGESDVDHDEAGL